MADNLVNFIFDFGVTLNECGVAALIRQSLQIHRGLLPVSGQGNQMRETPAMDVDETCSMGDGMPLKHQRESTEGPSAEHLDVVSVLLSHPATAVNVPKNDACGYKYWHHANATTYAAFRPVDEPAVGVATTPLFIASVNGNPDIVRALLERGDVCVNDTTNDSVRMTALYAAASHGHGAIVTLLLARPEVEVDRPRSDDGSTPLLAASKQGHDGVVTALLEKGAAVNAVNHSKQTSLNRAVSYGHLGVVRILIRAGADPACRDASGRTALEWSQENQHSDIADLLQQVTEDRAKMDTLENVGGRPSNLVCPPPSTMQTVDTFSFSNQPSSTAFRMQ